MIKLMPFSEEQVSLRNLSLSSNERGKGRITSFSAPRLSEAFVFILKGEIRFDIDYSLPEIAGEGDVVYIPGGITGVLRYSGEENEYISVTFNTTGGKFFDTLTKFSHSDLSEKAKDIIETITNTLQSDETVNPFSAYSYIYSLVYSLKNESGEMLRKYACLSPALDAMKKDYHINYKLSDYAIMCDMSTSNFRKLFTEYTGESPITYRTRLRLKHAEELLRSGIYSKKEIAVQTGFNTPSYFAREYKKYKK